ncbi:MAG: L-threonylcarbamoyladenylate synthase [Bacteroidia bacterium]|nr:L-threonylcarbamoyladenylate synthase [Bacteroidia bacterium]MDW8089487.1 L-threonylcarbamoyladenylate synthase [Bacteroidia bacterium]
METQISADLTLAQRLLEGGEVVAIPTETVYGLAANALNPEAIQKIFQLKGRPLWNPLIVHIGSVEVLKTLGIEFPEWAQRLAAHFWPGPLTLLLRSSEAIPRLVRAGLPRVAVRQPAHPLTLELLRRLPFPVAAPSANPFGRLSPTTSAHVYQYFAGQIPFILEGGPCQHGLESTIIGEEAGRFVLYRPGAIPRERIEAILGEKLHAQITAKPAAVQTPGQFSRHYAPAKPLLYGWRQPPLELNASLVLFAAPEAPLVHPYLHLLSPTGNLQEAATALYAVLHACEAEPTEFILMQQLPSGGPLAETLYDRLRKATPPFVFTIGHSTHSWESFQALLAKYEIEIVVDLRKQPFSRYVPHFSQSSLRRLLYTAGIGYEWQPEAERLLKFLPSMQPFRKVALLCAEGEPQRCHRYALADQLTGHGFVVLHILPQGQLRLHRAPIGLPFGEKA